MNQKGKGQDDFQTPNYIFKQLQDIFNFTADAACTQENKLCEIGFTDGLNQHWGYHRVFCNPPFSAKKAWIEKAHKEVSLGTCPVCVMILPVNSMDSDPWHEFIYGKYLYQILHGRIAFIDPVTQKPKKGNPSGTAIVYFMRKPNIKDFA